MVEDSYFAPVKVKEVGRTSPICESEHGWCFMLRSDNVKGGRIVTNVFSKDQDVTVPQGRVSSTCII